MGKEKSETSQFGEHTGMYEHFENLSRMNPREWLETVNASLANGSEENLLERMVEVEKQGYEISVLSSSLLHPQVSEKEIRALDNFIALTALCEKINLKLDIDVEPIETKRGVVRAFRIIVSRGR